MQDGLGRIFSESLDQTACLYNPQIFRIAVLSSSVLDIEEGALPFPVNVNKIDGLIPVVYRDGLRQLGSRQAFFHPVIGFQTHVTFVIENHSRYGERVNSFLAAPEQEFTVLRLICHLKTQEYVSQLFNSHISAL